MKMDRHPEVMAEAVMLVVMAVMVLLLMVQAASRALVMVKLMLIHPQE